MKPEDIFDIVLERVREYRALSDRIVHEKKRFTRTGGRVVVERKRIKSAVSSKGHITAIRPDACAKDGPPKVGDFRHEYIADFQLAGEKALRDYPKRFRLFVLFYVEGLPRMTVIRRLNTGGGAFDRWCDHIRRAVGEELRTTDLFPPRLYRKRVDVIGG